MIIKKDRIHNGILSLKGNSCFINCAFISYAFCRYAFDKHLIFNVMCQKPGPTFNRTIPYRYNRYNV